MSACSGIDPRIPLSAVYHRVHIQWRVHVCMLVVELRDKPKDAKLLKKSRQ